MKPLHKKRVDLHFQIPFWRGPYFLAVIAGKDQRANKQTTAHEKRYYSSFYTSMIALLILVFLLASGFFSFLAIVYLVKMWAGIDIIRGSSLIPELLRALKFCH